MADNTVIWEGNVEGQRVTVLCDSNTLDIRCSGKATSIIVDSAKTFAIHALVDERARLRTENEALQVAHAKDVGLNADLIGCLNSLDLEVRTALNLLGPEYFDEGKPLEALGNMVHMKDLPHG